MSRMKTDKIAVPIITFLSILVPGLVLALMLMPERFDLVDAQVGTFPFFHAVLNGITALLLILGYRLMRKGDFIAHRNVMITAFVLSTVFLLSYVISKASNDPVPYGGEGVMRYIYFFVLVTHILLSAIIVPLVLFTMYRGLTRQYDKHARIARWTFPIWLYVAITGVLVYLFMMPYY